MNIFQQKHQLTEAQSRANQVAMFNQQGLDSLKQSVTNSFHLVWYASNPQAVLDEFGSSAVELFQASVAAQEFIKQFDNTWVDLVTPYEFTINEDGTVTVGELKEGFTIPEFGMF